MANESLSREMLPPRGLLPTYLPVAAKAINSCSTQHHPLVPVRISRGAKRRSILRAGLDADRRGHHFQDSPQSVVSAHAAFVEGSSWDRLPVVAGGIGRE
jgi:hypothetical protein